MYSNHSMARERDREFAKQLAREARESMAPSSSKEQEQHRGRFEVCRRSSKDKNLMERILGTYENFKKVGVDKNSLLGVYQQPATPVAPREPIHDPDSYPPILPPPQTSVIPHSGLSSSSLSPSSKSSQRSLPPPHSSRNGTTRALKEVPLASGKPLHPPSHPSQHSQPRNGEVKGNLKSGPSSGPGDGGGGGGGGKITPMGKPNLPPLKLGGGGVGGDGDSEEILLQRMRAEMLVRNPPVSAIIQTPRPDHHDITGTFPFSAHTPIKDASSRSSRRGDDHNTKFNKPSDVSALKIPKPLDGGNVKGDLSLSEESEDDQVGTRGSSDSKTLLSPISGKTSDDSSSEDDSSDDSELSSNNTTEDEQPVSEPASPKVPGGDKSPNPWKLEKFIPPRKNKSPSFQEIVTPGPTDGNSEVDAPVVDKAPVQSQRKRDRRNSKAAVNNGTHRGSRHNHEPVLHSDDSSDEGERLPRPTPRPFPQLRIQKSRQTKAKPARRVTNNHQHDSDSDSDSFRRSKSDSNQSTFTSSSSCKGTSNLPDKSRKSSDSAVPRESTRRAPKKRTDSKKDNQSGAKPDSGKSRRVMKSIEIIPREFDSDSEGIIDVENTTPVKLQTTPCNNTPSRTPKECSRMPSPVKVHQPSPHVSPMPSHSVSSKNSSKRTPVSESQSSEPLPSVKSDDLFGRSQGNSDKLEMVTRDKGPLINPAFTLDKEKKKGRERDPVERVSNRKSKTHNNRDTKKAAGAASNSSESKYRSKTERSKGVSESSPLDNRLSVRSAASPLVDKLSESPIVSPEPKVPIPQLHNDYGSRKLTCTIPLSLIDKVPKPIVNNVMCIPKSEVKEEVDKKEVLDNRTTGKGGKGKRKNGDPNSKELCNEDKKTFIISSIFRCARKPDSENDSEKFKKEPKTEPVNSDGSDNEKSGSKSFDNIKVKEEVEESIMGRPNSVRQHNVSSSSSTPDPSFSSSKQHRKKKKDSLQEKSPSSSRDRKKPRCNSERHAPDYSSLNTVGDTNSLDSCDVHSSLRLTGVESDHGTSRKRGRERESSLESTRSSSHSESGGRRSKKSRILKTKDVKDSSMKSPSVRPPSQRVSDSNSSHAWGHEKDVQPSSYPQRTQLSQKSTSQYSQKGYNGISEDAVSNHGTEYVNEEEGVVPATAATVAPNSVHQGYIGKVKLEESQKTPNTDSGYYHSRPTSEHESRLDGGGGGSSYRSSVDRMDAVGEALGSSGDQLENVTSMIPPSQSHKQLSSFSGFNMAASQAAISDPAALEAYYANTQKRMYPSYFEKKMVPEINTDYMGFMNMAKHLKHTADAEKDRCLQAMKYLEAALYFILSGKAMENDSETETSASLRIYKDTLSFIKYVASVFMREKQGGSLNTKLAVISLRCQSLLSLKIYKMRRHEHKEVQRELNNYFTNSQNCNKQGSAEATANSGNNANNANNSWNGQRTSGSPSHLSQTPSPAGSVGSEGSQSSGYTTSTEGARSKNSGSTASAVGHTPPHPQPPPPGSANVPVPHNIHALFVKQNQLSGHLATAHDMWIEADNYVYKNGMEDFFIGLDRVVSPLTLHSSLSELVYYVQCGLQRLKD